MKRLSLLVIGILFIATITFSGCIGEKSIEDIARDQAEAKAYLKIYPNADLEVELLNPENAINRDMLTDYCGGIEIKEYIMAGFMSGDRPDLILIIDPSSKKLVCKMDREKIAKIEEDARKEQEFEFMKYELEAVKSDLEQAKEEEKEEDEYDSYVLGVIQENCREYCSMSQGYADPKISPYCSTLPSYDLNKDGQIGDDEFYNCWQSPISIYCSVNC